MGLVNVPGLGVVEIAGDVPTEAEDLEMQQLLAERQLPPPTPPAAPPADAPSPTIRESVSRLPAAVQEPLDPLVGLYEGFATMGDPRSERPWYEQAVRGPAARVSKLVRGATLETPLAIAEGVFGLEEAGIPAGMTAAEAVASPDVEISPSAALNQYWQEWEEDLYRPSESVPSEAWGAVADDPSRFAKFLLEGVTSTLPDYAATLVAGPARYAASLVGDMAKGRAAERGDGRVRLEDVAVAAPAAAAISGLNTAAQRFGLSGAAVNGIMRTAARSALAETVTELPQTWIETVARQAGARPGGVSEEALREGTIAAATIAPLAGGLAGPAGATLTRAGRALAETPAARSERAVSAEVDRLLAESEALPAPDEAPPIPPPILADAPVDPAAEPAPDEPVVEAVIEQAETEGGRVPGYYTQVAPPPLPVEAGPEVSAVDVQMEKDALADSIKEVRAAVDEAAAEREVAPRPSGARLRAVVDKGAKRRRVEEIDTPAAPLSAKDALRRLALLSNAATASEADIADAINDYVVAEESAEGAVSAPRNIDNIDRLKQVAAEMGRTDEEIDALLSHQQMSFAQVIDAMDSAGLRSVLTEDGRGVVIPQATADAIVRINQGEYTPTNVETAAIHSTYRSILRARENILEAASDPALEKRDLAALNKLDAELRQQELDALLAQRRGATPAARALRFRQYLMDEVMNMVQAQARATMKKRKPLTDKEVAEIERLWDLAENAEAEAVASEKSARAALAKAQKRLKKAEDVLRGAEEVKRGAAKKARKPRKKTPRQEAAKREAEDKPIRVSPIRKSAEQKRLEKEFKAAQKAAAKAADKVQKAKTAVRKAKRDKSEVPDKAIHPWLALYRKAFGGALVLNSSGDNSALGRQALGLAIQNPGAAIKTLGVALRAAPWVAGHRDYAKRVQEEMLASPLQRLRDAAGLQMTEVEGLSNIEGGSMDSREEQWMFRALETGFFGDYLVVPSQNVFGLTLNKLRTINFDEGAALLAERHGVDLDEVSKMDLSKAPKWWSESQLMTDLKGLALLINVSTGRGTWTGDSLGVARHLMFAPRYTMSRFELPIRALQLAAGKGAFDEVSPRARELFMRRAGRQVAWGAGMLLMSAISAAANDEDVTDAVDAFFDPEDPDFLKMRIGDYHIDLMQGLGATWRYVWPFALSPGRAAEKGDITEFVGGREGYGRAYLQLFRNKLAPLVSGLVSMYPGIDYRGRFISDLPRSESTGQRLLEAGRGPGLGVPARGSRAEGAMATLLDRVIFPAGGMVTPITVKSVASEWLESATDKEKEKLQLLVPVALNFFGVGAAHYEDRKKRGKKAKPFSGYFQ